MHSLCPVNSTSIILYGGYYTEKKQYFFVGDLWIYTINIEPTPTHPNRWGENRNTWHKVNDTLWGTLPGTVRPKGRRGHVAAYLNHKLYVFGGMVFDGLERYDLSGREYRSRNRLKNDMFEWHSVENQWRLINPVSLDGIPGPRYMLSLIHI